MADPPPPRHPREARPRIAPSTPRWVKVFAVIGIVVVLLVVVLLIFGGGPGGGHGPGRHTPPSTTTEQGVQQP